MRASTFGTLSGWDVILDETQRSEVPARVFVRRMIMILCPDLKIGFIHVYKTGGSSITKILHQHTSPAWRLQEGLRFEGPGWQEGWHYKGQQHAKYRHFHHELGSLVDDNWKWIVVPRNPYTWLASIYYEFYAKPLPVHSGQNFDFGMFGAEHAVGDFPRFYHRYKAGHPSFYGFSTQTSFWKGIEKDKMIFVRFESYEEDVKHTFAKLGIGITALPHEINRGNQKRRHIEHILSNPTFRAFVSEEFQEDFRLHQYPI